MKNLEKLLSNNDEANAETVHVALTKEDLFLLNAALHSHQRAEIEYLLSIKEAMTQEELFHRKKEIEEKCQSVKDKLFTTSETTP